MAKYTAKISRNFRDVATGAPKVLLRDIFDNNGELFRDHAHVEITPAIQKTLNCMRSNRSFIVELEAEEKEYNYQNSNTIKRTLTNVTRVKVLGKA